MSDVVSFHSYRTTPKNKPRHKMAMWKFLNAVKARPSSIKNPAPAQPKSKKDLKIIPRKNPLTRYGNFCFILNFLFTLVHGFVRKSVGMFVLFAGNVSKSYFWKRANHEIVHFDK